MIVATAGHVDHGKTTLIRALTGVDTDRLLEEKQRGMTIDLGFAYLPLQAPASTHAEPIGFVDVPGHQRFIRNMLCGVGGIDFALLVIAADDGPRPQTAEHLAILDLLDIRCGAVALTKIDRVSTERRADVLAEITALLAGTTLADVPVFQLSAPKGVGIDALKAHLMSIAQGFPARAASGNFRLAVDRCFTLSGAGLVVTGIAVSGSLATGETVSVLGLGAPARARSIHAQSRDADRGSAGQRCAINLAGIALKNDAISRGEWIVAGPVPGAQAKFDARLRILPSEPKSFVHWTPVHIHLGAATAIGRIAVLDGKAIEPGQSALVQLVLDRPVGAVHADRFIVRDQSAQRTIGGGRVIDVFPPTRGRSRPERLAQLAAMETADPVAALTALLDCAPSGVQLVRFQTNCNLTPGEAATLFAQMTMKQIATASGLLAFSTTRWNELRSSVLEELAAWHERSPDVVGPPVDRILQHADHRLPRETVIAIATELAREGVMVKSGIGVRLPSHRPHLDIADEAQWQEIEPLLLAGALRPPSVAEISYAIGSGVKKIEATLVRTAHCGRTIKVSPRRYFLPAAVIALAEIMRTLAAQSPRGAVTASEFRDKSGIGRNLTIEVLEFFDKVKFTRRLGDGRIVNCDPGQLFSDNIE
jgi:selenocysteine-specific elongation factor